MARSLVTADMDHDGDLDVIAAAVGADEVSWWENQDGLGTIWVKDSVDSSFDGAYWLHTADVDGDIDVLGAAAFANTIAWWENMDGVTTTSMEHTVDDAFMLAVGVYGADMDQDGDIDILGAAYDDNDMTWWENTVGDDSNQFTHEHRHQSHRHREQREKALLAHHRQVVR